MFKLFLNHSSQRLTPYWNSRLAIPLLVSLISALGCGGGSNHSGGPANYTISGNVSGLSGDGLVLRILANNQGQDQSIGSNGPFTFDNAIPNGSAFTISIQSQPHAQICSITNGTGTVSGTNVTNVAVNCHASDNTNTYTIGGNASGLEGNGLVLLNNSDNLRISANGPFTFAASLANGASYHVVILTQPTGQTCSLANGTGNVNGANVTNLAVTCISHLPIVNGVVKAIVQVGKTLFLGGSFSQIGGDITGGGAPLDASAGRLSAGISPLAVNGRIYAVVSDGQGGWYIGGSFGSVGATSRRGLARINADGSLHPWNPDAGIDVHAIAVSGNTIFVGGFFETIGGPTVRVREHLAAFDATSGELLPWNPIANDIVESLTVSGGVIYAGGYFTTIGGFIRNRLAAIDATSGLTLPWSPDTINGTVRVLAVTANTIYAGGDFSMVGTVSRNHLAAFDRTLGSLLPWDPNANNNVYALAAGDNTVYLGGYFTAVGGGTRLNLAAVDAISGALLPWKADVGQTVAAPGFDYLGVDALALSGSTIYVGGLFDAINGVSRSNCAAIDASSGSLLPWNPSVNDNVDALAVSGTTIYLGGAFTAIGGVSRKNLAAIDTSSGSLLPWNLDTDSVAALTASGGTLYVGGYFGKIGAMSRDNLAAIDANSGAVLSWNPKTNGPVDALVVNGGVVYTGGWFTSINQTTRNNLAAIDAISGVVLPWNPNIDGGVTALAVSNHAVYAGGYFATAGGTSRHHLAAVDATTGALLPWNPSPDSPVEAIAASEGAIYVGGWFTSIGNVARSSLAAIDQASGAVLPLSADPAIGGPIDALALQGSTLYVGGSWSLAAVDKDSGSTVPGSLKSLWVNAIATNGSTVYVGGSFTTVDGQITGSLARFDANGNLF